MTDKQSARQKRYRTREKARATALMGGGTEIELAWFGVNKDGYHVALDYDLKPVVLRPIVVTSPEQVEEPTAEPSKKVYAPKSWPAEVWNRTVSVIQDKGMAKDEAVSALGKTSKGTDKDKTMLRHAKAVFEALPDVPDWYVHLPLAEVSD